MPRPKLYPKKAPVQPFSLILEPSELDALRKIADREKTSVAAIVRRAIHTVMYRANPEQLNRMVESEIDAFLNRVAEKFPPAWIGGA